MKKWRIKTTKDWVIAAGLLFLLSCLAVSGYRQRINEWLMKFSPEKLSIFNQPEHQGVYLFALVLAAVLFSLLWIWQRTSEGKPVKKVLVFLWAGTAALMAGVLCSYQLECRQIVRTPYETDLVPDISVTCKEGEAFTDVVLTREQEETLLTLCLRVQALSKEDQEKWSQEKEAWDYEIMIRYPEYRNHRYSLWFCLQDGVLGLRRGHSQQEKIYYDGTEIGELLSR